MEVDRNVESDPIFQKDLDLEYDPRKSDRSEACLQVLGWVMKICKLFALPLQNKGCFQTESVLWYVLFYKVGQKTCHKLYALFAPPLLSKRVLLRGKCALVCVKHAYHQPPLKLTAQLSGLLSLSTSFVEKPFPLCGVRESPILAKQY
jgi:hypothetical protein